MPISSILSGLPPIRYVGPLMDVSGYGEASRHHVLALIDHGARIVVDNAVYTTAMNPSGVTDPLHARVADVLRRQGSGPCPSAPINIYHLPPSAYPHFRSNRGGLHIAAALWETSRFPSEWVDVLNSGVQPFHQAWCASKWQAGVFRDSGVKIPLAVVPYGLDEQFFPGNGPDLPGVRTSVDETIFYSIFQWTPRKNPEGIIKAYFDAFTTDDPVLLVIKSYRNEPTHPQAQVEEVVAEVVKELRHPKPPRIKVIGRHLSRDEILALHRTCDVYVGLSRGEGWFFPAHEAMIMGNPAVLTDWSAQTEFASVTSAWMVGQESVPVEPLPGFRWYQPEHQQWAEPYIDQAAAHMYRAHTDKEGRRNKGAAARQEALRFSPEHMARCTLEALQPLVGAA